MKSLWQTVWTLKLAYCCDDVPRRSIRRTFQQPTEQAPLLRVYFLLRSPFFFALPTFSPRRPRSPCGKDEKQTSHQIFLLQISAKLEYFKLLTIKGTGRGLAFYLFLESTHLLPFLSNPSLAFLALHSLGHHPREQVSGGTGRTRLSLDKSQPRSSASF